MYKYILNPDIPLNQILRFHTTTNHELVTNWYNKHRVFEFEEIQDPSLQYQTSIILDNEKSTGIRLRTNCLREIDTGLPEGMSWGPIQQNSLSFVDAYLLEQIRTRYAFFERPVSGLSNIIIDNYMPKLLYVTRFDQARINNVKLPKTIYTISPWFAQMFGAQVIPTEQLCRILGYDVKRLKQLITKVKHNDYSITFVGYGGTNVNTIYWLTEIMKLTQSINLFSYMNIYEPDNLEISNILRFPKNPNIENNLQKYGRFSPTSKLRLLEPAELNLLSKSEVEIFRDRINGARLPYNKKYTTQDSNNPTSYRRIPKERHIFYGAPNIDTRISFNDVGHFISATHNGNDAHLWLNPTQDADLQVESYGLIQLTPFFMNQLRMAIGLLEILAEGNLNLKEKDKLLLEYSFDGVSKMTTNKVYNFQLGHHSGTVATETEAALNW